MRCLDPLLSSARRDLAAAGHSGVLAEHLLQRLGLRMVKLASRTLVLELARARDRGELAGATPAARFLDFTHRLVGGSELAEFLATYPVLARVLGESPARRRGSPRTAGTARRGPRVARHRTAGRP